MQRRTALDPRSTLRSERAQSTQRARLPRHLAAAGAAFSPRLRSRSSPRRRAAPARRGRRPGHGHPGQRLPRSDRGELHRALGRPGRGRPGRRARHPARQPRRGGRRRRARPASSSGCTTRRSPSACGSVRRARRRRAARRGVVEAAKYRGLAPGSRLEVDGQHIGADEAFRTGKTNIPASCDRQRGSTEGCSATIGDFVVSIPGVP